VTSSDTEKPTNGDLGLGQSDHINRMITLLVITLSGLYIKQYYYFPTIGHNQMDAMLQVQEKTRRELECVICLEIPQKEDHVFSCLEHHLICLECSKHTLRECPVCRKSYGRNGPLRNRMAEKLILQLL
jgi:hypothetical protein